MRRLILIVLVASLAGCAHNVPRHADPRPFAGAVWVAGHYSRTGYYIHGHWI